MSFTVDGGQPLVTLGLLMFALSLDRFLSLREDPSSNIRKLISVRNIIWMPLLEYTKKSYRFKMWMEVVGQILIKWETSFIRVVVKWGNILSLKFPREQLMQTIPSHLVTTEPCTAPWKMVLSGCEVSSTASLTLCVRTRSPNPKAYGLGIGHDVRTRPRRYC